MYKSIVLEWFDPLGRPPPKEAVKESMIWNKIVIQDEASVACGGFAVDFVKRRLKGEDFSSIIHSYSSNLLFNDILLWTPTSSP